MGVHCRQGGRGDSTVAQSHTGAHTGARFLTVAEVAALLRVSTMTVYRLIKAGELASVRVGKSYRVREDDVDAYLAARYTEAG
ncbi:MAG: DNA-binding protein [Acidimicrobiales bacterium]|jgi:excisionase family DNA binding protein|nr:DNA-binding protein [Acidimicrobiales bacterium]